MYSKLCEHSFAGSSASIIHYQNIHQVQSLSEVIADKVTEVDTESQSYSQAIPEEKETEEQLEMGDFKDAFSSNELVGERKIVDKPALPANMHFTLRKEAPITQKPNAIVTSEPVFKQATSLRKLGDMVWPPKSGMIDESNRMPEPIPSGRQQKNYQKFFGQHQLNPSFPMYRAPPGTQHFGLEDGENADAM